MNPMRLRACWGLIGLGLLLVTPAAAKMSDWRDAKGKKFRGEPTGILGPFAVFRTGPDQGRRVPLRAFSPEHCLRLHAALAARPRRAENLAAARGEATAELPGHVLQVRDGQLEPADLAARPEPELLLVLGGSHNSGEGWFLSGNLNRFYHRLQRLHPGLVEGVFLGVRHDAGQHRNLAIHSGMPWLVADLDLQGALRSLNRYLPREGANAVLLTREGVPLLGAQAGDVAGVRAVIDQVAELLWQIDPANPAGWADRRHYLAATRPVEFASARADPVLVGDPLRPAVLREYGVRRVTARLAVAADGKVSPVLLTDQCEMPAELVAPLTEALSHVVAVPAIDRGRAVPGELAYRLDVPPADAEREAERAWLEGFAHPELTIPEWLVLRPIEVPEQDFAGTVVGRNPDGTIILSPMEVNTGKVSRRAQLGAFHRDWFAAAGADSVRPRAGDRQRIDDGTVLTWEKVRSVDGWVNMQSGLLRDYTVGYAWAEFESPRATDAWLGLGSDDGVKLWLNGELVHDQWVRRPSRVDDEIVPLRLKPGANRILIKIQNVTDQWSFTYRLRLKP